MNRIIIALFAFTFVQLVSSQTACQQAQLDYSTDLTCSTAADSATICMGNCRTLLDNITSTCDNATAAVYITIFDTYCSPCGMATLALAADTACVNATDAITVCMGDCRTLYDNVINNCNDSTAATYSAMISNFCDGGNAACTNAAAALASNTACANATTADDICTGTCRDLYDDIIGNCDALTSARYSTVINTLCGSGTTPNPADAACEAAVFAVSSTCDDLLFFADPSLCSTCQSEVSTVTSACRSASADYRGFSYAYETACSSGVECTAALTALNANTTCINAFDNDQTEISCGETCLSFSNAAFSACPNNAFITSNRNGLYEDCGINTGGGGDGGALIMKASGIVTLLFVAVFAVIF